MGTVLFSSSLEEEKRTVPNSAKCSETRRTGISNIPEGLWIVTEQLMVTIKGQNNTGYEYALCFEKKAYSYPVFFKGMRSLVCKPGYVVG